MIYSFNKHENTDIIHAKCITIKFSAIHSAKVIIHISVQVTSVPYYDTVIKDKALTET